MSITTSPPLVCLLLLSLTWLTSWVTGDDAAVFLRAGTSLSLADGSAAPHSAVWAGSLATCALACVAIHSRLCRGVTFSAAEKSCLMYSTCSDWPLTGQAVAGDGLVSFSRDRPNCPDTCECPPGFILCAGHCLLGLEEWTNYTTAALRCETLGAHLAVPRSDPEMNCIRQIADTQEKTHVWLGVNDMETEGEFAGIDGCGPVSVLSSWWADGQPNGERAENYVASTPDGWFDSGLNVKNLVCQLADCYKPQCP
ncbi:CD209 antigen-like protein C [Amphibalanus amphitrite]|uniref:CD209 antigen-like protein C n=1 Tax=Amphibalanus amphitrite TaxID=1232801 RepID=A0A6A4VXJ2_AMPAM|nr:CD209 antigen-like protein C [Amphibalanus amphitrite]